MLLITYIQLSLFGKTSWERFLQMTGWTLEPSYPLSRTPKFQCLLREDGETPEWCEGERLMCAGGSWTPSIGQAPEGWHEGSGFSSRRILEADVPQTYYLRPHTGIEEPGADDVFQHFFQREAVPFIHSQKEEREHEADHQEHGSAVPDTATGKQVSREAHRRRAGKTNKLALRQVEGQLCLDFGKVFWYWNIGHLGTPPSLLRASMARGYLAASLAGAVLRAASTASRPLCLARQYSG